MAGADRSVLVNGCGERIVGSSLTSGAGSICFESFRGPVRTVEGRICSKPWEEATFSMDLKYCETQSLVIYLGFEGNWIFWCTLTVLT